MSEKITLRDVHKTFGTKQVLRGVNLSIEKGQSLVVIGGSGSGKSVMLKSILGLLTPEQGSILIDGKETVGLARDHRREIDHQMGMLFQNGALFDSLPVWRNVAFQGMQNDGLSEADARD
ncbi:ATP-binding cassette domain-containing protein, partial [Alphaproteobacteria bacterium]|nr:ATP-binding cassette domain-containing protein [Alphaproteobacteria bacterium]